MHKVRVGVIGVGTMGRHHARAYAHFKYLCEFVGVHDVNPVNMATVAEKYEVTAFPRVEDLLSEVDAVTIAAPTGYHYELAEKALTAGVHVLVEKPVCRTVTEARRLERLAQDRGCVVQVGHIERFNPAVQELAKLLQRYPVVAVDVKRMGPFDPRVRDLDVIQDMMVHDIDILRYLLQAEIVDVHAEARKVKSSTFADHAVCTARLSNGVIASLTASRVTEQRIRVMNVTCQGAYIEMDYIDRRLTLSRDSRLHYGNNGKQTCTLENVGERIYVPDEEPLLAQTQHFLECVLYGRQPLIGVPDGRAALEVVERIQEQVYDERAVPSLDGVAV
ncbi:MAG: Gfo/Idh/MocA family oxidoreductase [Firmicutes bacterium]|nr:Gfo/Idh/MocA family oxidoreductase [Bacillota bacterium]